MHACVCAKSLQSCSTVCSPMDCSLPGSSIHGILQARIPEWVAMPSSRGSSQPRDQPRSPMLQADSLPAEPPGKPKCVFTGLYNPGFFAICLLLYVSSLSRSFYFSHNISQDLLINQPGARFLTQMQRKKKIICYSSGKQNLEN